MDSASGAGASAPEPRDVPRRHFVNILLGPGLLASAASFFYPVLRYLVPPKLPDMGSSAVLAAKVSELKPNTAKTFRFGTRPGLLVQTSAGEYRAMSATCTHLGCTVQYLHRHMCCAGAHCAGISDLSHRVAKTRDRIQATVLTTPIYARE